MGSSVVALVVARVIGGRARCGADRWGWAHPQAGAWSSWGAWSSGGAWADRVGAGLPNLSSRVSLVALVFLMLV